jgi:hypothetical protein
MGCQRLLHRTIGLAFDQSLEGYLAVDNLGSLQVGFKVRARAIVEAAIRMLRLREPELRPQGVVEDHVFAAGLAPKHGPQRKPVQDLEGNSPDQDVPGHGKDKRLVARVVRAEAVALGDPDELDSRLQRGMVLQFVQYRAAELIKAGEVLVVCVQEDDELA